jgi:polyketide biosynthesis enoyl-CoA hydratase PksI
VAALAPVACEVEGGVALVRMQDEAGANALSVSMVHALEEALGRVAARDDVKVAVLAGRPGHFSTGASREVLLGLAGGRIAPADLLLPRALLDLPVPLVAAMEGHAVGGGLALALCADVIVAARESRYGCNFMDYGFTPGMGTTGLLEYVLGPALAHEMLLTGALLKGSRFEGRGFNHVVPRAEVLGKARDLASRIADKPALALRALKPALAARKRAIFESARGVEVLLHRLTLPQPEVRERIEEALGLSASPARTG